MCQLDSACTPPTTSTSKIAARSFSKNPGLHEPVTTASNSSIHSAVQRHKLKNLKAKA
jgi:hypothetical protein